MSSSRLVPHEDQKDAEEVDQSQVGVQHVAPVQKDALVVQHLHAVQQDPKPQDLLVEQGVDLQVEAPMAPSRRQEVQEDPIDLRTSPTP